MGSISDPGMPEKVATVVTLIKLQFLSKPDILAFIYTVLINLIGKSEIPNALTSLHALHVQYTSIKESESFMRKVGIPPNS